MIARTAGPGPWSGGGILFLLLLAFWTRVESAPLPPLAEKYCVACHLPPAPDILPQDRWMEVFGFMSVWIQERNLPFDLEEYRALLRDYRTRAPEQLLLPDPSSLAPPAMKFEKREVGHPAGKERPVINDLRIVDLDQDGRPEVLVCDNAAGQVSLLRWSEGAWTEEDLFAARAPSRAVPVDIDQDGRLDFAVGSYGSILPTDLLVGSVSLMIQQDDGSYTSQLLLEDCARVADVKAGDFNGDGKPDLLVVQFGWRKTGGLLLLEQQSPSVFISHAIADINGALQAEVLDFDGDGRLDFIVLFAQEHESLVLFRNEGGGRFSARVLARGPHPAFGSSGFTLIDLDGDGDLDILWTNGDMMDEISLAKPYHGLHWLENREGTFLSRELLRMPGCYRVAPYDLDGDGDLDLVVSSLYPAWDLHGFPSLIWLENDGRQQFTARVLLDTPQCIPSLVVGDFDGDGLPDILVGGMHLSGPTDRMGRITALMGLQPTSPPASGN